MKIRALCSATIIVLTVGYLSNALAGVQHFDCRTIFSEPQTPSFAAYQQVLKLAPMADFNPSSILLSPAAAKESSQVFERFIAKLRARAFDKSGLPKPYMARKIAVLSQLEEDVRAFSHLPTYQQSVDLGSRLSILATSIEMPQTNWAPDRPSSLNDLHIENRLKSGMILVPTDHSLTIVDFNRLVGTGIAPLGLIIESVRVDGRDMHPLRFFEHDDAHGLFTMVGALPLREINFWHHLLDQVDKQRDPRTKSLMHSLLFFITHENGRTSKKMFNRASFDDDQFLRSNEIEIVQKRLSSENGWDQQPLIDRPPETEELVSTLRRLMNLAKQSWQQTE